MPEDTKQRIQLAALEMFMAQGYDGTSMDAVAEAVGITKPAVYYHFDSKQELFIVLLEGLFEGIITEYLAAMSAQPTLREMLGGLFAMIDEIESAFGNEESPIDLGYVALLMDAARRFPDEVGETMDRFYHETRSLIAERVVIAQETGEVRSDADPEAFALLCVALVEGIVLVGALAPSCDFRGRESELLDIVWTGIANETE